MSSRLRSSTRRSFHATWAAWRTRPGGLGSAGMDDPTVRRAGVASQPAGTASVGMLVIELLELGVAVAAAVGGALLVGDAAAAQDDDVIGEVGDRLEVVGDDHQDRARGLGAAERAAQRGGAGA